MHCQLDEGHDGPHREAHGKNREQGARNVIVTWEGDDGYLDDDVQDVEDLMRDLPPEGSLVS